MDKEKSNKSLLLNLGPREFEIFDFIKELSNNTNANDNRNEIIRRGLNSFQYLIQTNENLLLNELSINLKYLYHNLDWERFVFAKNLALLCYAIMICKKGISESENFESIILNMDSIEISKDRYSEDEKSKRIINEIFDHIIKSIDLIFLKKMIELPKSLKSYYVGESPSIDFNSVTKLIDEKVLAGEVLGQEIKRPTSTSTSKTILLEKFKE
jgi:hypothetical protein